ncbi:hypothetical protein LJJ44_08830 [Pseudomonas sp. B24_DOA]|nr:hypothetical protein LJJ44_08830 [Pseudomonas sp. B24_DOA]WKV87398.1 hypothetical protein LJU32_16870 [Pseudomonas sp. B21_DOA]
MKRIYLSGPMSNILDLNFLLLLSMTASFEPAATPLQTPPRSTPTAATGATSCASTSPP